MVRGLLEGLGLPVGDERPNAVTELEPLPRLLGHPSPEQLFARDSRYGQVICACEQVTAAEIAAVHGMAVPPTSLEGVRKRTRATGGRCQGAFCLSGVSFLHSLHAGRRPQQIAVSEPDATLGVGTDDA
jgi:glycerol-3-phosphate dehydrogenase